MKKEQLRIFYIDDEPELCEIFFEEFSSELFEIITFTDPQLAISAGQVDPPDLLFIDYRLPGSTGEIVADFFLKSIPKYLVTGEITTLNLSLFKGVFSKPISRTRILETMEHYFILKKRIF